MRSKKQPDGQETFIGGARRRQFVACAIESLAESGYQATSVAEVAQRAGVAKSVVLYHFGSREALMEAVVSQVYGDATALLRPQHEAEPDVRAQVLTYVRGAVTWAWSHQTEARAVLEVARNLRDGDGRLRGGPGADAALVEGLRDRLEQGQRDGELGDFDAWTVAALVRSTIDGMSERFMADPELDGPEVAEELVRLVDRLIAPPARSRTTRKEKR